MSRRLGRGLAALIPDDIFEEDAPTSQRDALRQLPLDRIQPNPEQPRMVFSGVALEQLAESIRAHGVITPILVRKHDNGRDFVLVAGERRLRAAGLAGLEEVPCWVREHLSTREQLELALVENIQREDLDPIESAEAYSRLVGEFGLTQAEVARRVGKDRATIANSIRLLKLPDFALRELRQGRISAGHAKALLALPEDALIRKALREVVTRDLSVRATERLVQTMTKGTKRQRNTRPSYPVLDERLTRSLGTRVKIEANARGSKGRIVIDYFSAEELERLVGKLDR